jgi:hypothetical protein
MSRQLEWRRRAHVLTALQTGFARAAETIGTSTLLKNSSTGAHHV